MAKVGTNHRIFAEYEGARCAAVVLLTPGPTNRTNATVLGCTATKGNRATGTVMNVTATSISTGNIACHVVMPD